MFKDDYQQTFSQVRPVREFDPEEIYMKASRKHTSVRRIASIAIAAALILSMSLTAYATDLFGLMDFLMPDHYRSTPTLEDPAHNASSYQPIAISGYTNSPEAKASAEWTAYYWDYVANNEIPNENIDGLPETAAYYGAANREMYDKLLEIANKYDLELMTGVESGKRAMHLLDGKEGSYYAYANGNFKEEGDFTASDGVTVGYSLSRHMKGSLSTISLNILDAENWVSWNHTTSTGDSAVVGLSGDLTALDGTPLGNRGLILVDLGDCFVSVLVIEWGQPITETVMQELAENIDYQRLTARE